MAAVIIDFDYTIIHALQCFGCPNLMLNPEQRESVRYVYEGGCVCMASNWVRQVVMSRNAPVCI